MLPTKHERCLARFACWPYQRRSLTGGDGPISTYLPSVTVLITTKNNAQTISGCLQSVVNLDYPRDRIECIVVDANSTDGTEEIINKYPVTLLRKECSAPAAYNFALGFSRGEVIAFLDGDAKASVDWLQKLVGHLQSPKIAGAGGTIRTWNFEKPLPRCIGYELEDRYQSMPPQITRISTTNLVLRKDAIMQVGMFDERLLSNYDADIGLKVVSRGYQIIFDPTAVVYHHHRSSMASYFRQQLTYARYSVKHFRIGGQSELASRDNVTTRWMYAQPFIYSCSFALLLLGLLMSAFTPSLASMIILLAVMSFLVPAGTYFVSAARLALKFRDLWAFVMIPPIFVTRSLAWTVGALLAIVRKTP